MKYIRLLAKNHYIHVRCTRMNVDNSNLKRLRPPYANLLYHPVIKARSKQ